MTEKELEKEADDFALMLLMPTRFFKEDMKQEVDLCGDSRIKELSNKYQVPENAVVQRILIYKQFNQ